MCANCYLEERVRIRKQYDARENALLEDADQWMRSVEGMSRGELLGRSEQRALENRIRHIRIERERCLRRLEET